MKNEDDSENETSRLRNWLDWLSHIITREPKDREELLLLLREAKARDVLDAQALAMIEGVLQVSVMRVRDVMVSRSQMVVLEEDAKLETVLPIVIESAHSRFPIIRESRDEVVGILLAKDLIAYTAQCSEKPFDLRDIMRPVVFVPESKRLDVLLREFRLRRHHMAMVVDEYGGIAGLVTIEDLLEEIVGEIEDEHDTAEDPYIRKHTENRYIVQALTPVEEFNRYFQEEFSDEEFDTVGGFVMGAFGHLPKRGETIQIQNYQFRVLYADSRRIRLLQIQVLK